MEKVDVNKIRARWTEEKEVEMILLDSENKPYGEHKQMEFFGGDDIEKSLKTIAEKVNEIVDFCNQVKDKYEVCKMCGRNHNPIEHTYVGSSRKDYPTAQ